MTEFVKRIYRSQDDSRMAGVCSGLGKYFGVDPVLVRLLWVAGTLVTGLVFGTVLYILAWLIVPLEPGAQRVEVIPPNPHAGAGRASADCQPNGPA